MLLLLLNYLVMFAACTCSGFLFYRIFPASAQLQQRPLIFCFFSGLIMLTTITQVAQLFIPISAQFQVFLLFILVALLFINRRSFSVFLQDVRTQLRSASPLFYIAASLIALIILLINAGPVISDDTESYHIQMVKWIREYGTVPGLVHLHSRFGFNSAWFSSIAVLNMPLRGVNFYTALNGLTGLCFIIYLLAIIDDRPGVPDRQAIHDRPGIFNRRGVYDRPGIHDRRHAKLSLVAFVVFAYCLVSWPLMRGNAATANYDYITMVMIITFLMEVMRSRGTADPSADRTPDRTVQYSTRLLPEAMLWTAFLFTVRIPNFPLLIIYVTALVMLWKTQRRMMFILVALSATMVISFLARNVILSGFAFYPSMAFDVFPVDWKADPGITTDLFRFIRNFNRVSTSYQDLDVTQKMSAVQWIPVWFRNMFSYDKLLFVPSMAGFVLFLFFARKRDLLNHRMVRGFVGVMLLQLITWFCLAPDPRFAYGPLMCGIMLLAATVADPVVKWIGRKLLNCFALALPIGLLIFSLSTRIDGALLHKLVAPQALRVPNTDVIMIGEVWAHRPQKFPDLWNPRCFGTDLPCLYDIDPMVRARGRTISEGFRKVQR